MPLNLLALTDISVFQGSVNWNPGAFPAGRITLTQNTVMTPVSVLPSGASLILMIVQDAVGGRTFTWPSQFKWPNGVVPTIGAAANAVNLVSLFCDGKNFYGNLLASMA